MELPVLESGDAYGFARAPERIERIRYGRFRNLYLYITEECQLRCGHCYMGDRLDRGHMMPTDLVIANLVNWRRMGSSKLSVLGGEPTLHPDFELIIDYANKLGYEQVILNTNALASSRRRLAKFSAHDFAYVQVSLDGGSAASHDQVRGRGTFAQAWLTTEELCRRGFDTRIICTVNKVNIGDCLNLLELGDQAGVSLVKYHVFSGIGVGNENADWVVEPPEWVAFCRALRGMKGKHRAKIWYQPTYARREDLDQYASEGYRGCIGRTLDRISVFPDGRAYVCSYLFDTSLNFAKVVDGKIVLNRAENEFDLFTSVLTQSACGGCKKLETCMGGCPAERLVMGKASCEAYDDVLPVCRLWKSEV